MSEISMQFEKVAIDIRLTRHEGKEPVPSHAGPAVSIRWVLTLNGIGLAEDAARFRWSETPEQRSNIRKEPPHELQTMYDRLVATFMLSLRGGAEWQN